MRDLTLVQADTPTSRNTSLLRSTKTENKNAFDLDRFPGKPNA